MDECEIQYDNIRDRVRFLRTTDRCVLDLIVANAWQGEKPSYAHLLHSFRETVRSAFVLRRGIVMLADAGHLIDELTVFTRELIADFPDPATGRNVGGQFLAHLLDVKFHQPPEAQALAFAIEQASCGNPCPLQALIRGCIDASSFPRLRWWHPFFTLSGG